MEVETTKEMRELSIFVDESGDFGEYNYRAPYYIITMVFHDQEKSIEDGIQKIETELTALGFSNHCVHNGPIIRGEEEYRYEDIVIRRKIFNKMVAFIRSVDISYHSFYIEKKHISDEMAAIGKLSKIIADFIRDHYEMFIAYDIVKVYYDNGQVEVTRILSSVFNALLPRVEFRKVIPSDYRLFQAADLLCTFQLLMLKKESGTVSNSERVFFGTNERDFKKNYVKPLLSKKI